MFEAKILQGSLLKKIIEAIRELVTDANLDCTERGIFMQVFYCNFIISMINLLNVHRQWILPMYLYAQ